MSERDNSECLVIITSLLGMLLMGAIAYVLGRYHEAKHWEDKMIEMKIAEWYADPKTGEKQLQYKCGEVRRAGD